MTTPGGIRRARKAGLWNGLASTAFVILLLAIVGPPEAPWWVVVLIGVGAGVAAYVLAGVLVTRGEHRLRPVAGGQLSEQQFDEAIVASRSGRAPADPWVRDAAIRIASHQLARLRGYRAPLIVLLSIGVVVSLFNWIIGNWTSLLSAVPFVVVFAQSLRESSRLSKVLARLYAHSPT